MLNTTLPRLKCPRCAGSLELSKGELPATRSYEVRSGSLSCRPCRAEFPILGGVALLVDDVGQYLVDHVKGIAQCVPDSEIPRKYLSAFLQAKTEIEIEHIEEDLEAERVNALYLMTHYLRTNTETDQPWWAPVSGRGSPLIDSLVRQHWDHGPFAQIERWIAALAKAAGPSGLGSLVELGCGVGGLYPLLRPHMQFYLGVDTSFVSIALGRHLALGVPYSGSVKIPADLLQGTVSREVKLPLAPSYDGRADFIVGDVANPPLERGSWDLTVALNMIDMLNTPEELPKLQHALLKNDGIAIQSCPYIWHETVARDLREMLPAEIRDSAKAVEWLYRQAGFEIREVVDQVPWLFFKHVRQLEIYSVHMFLAQSRLL